MRSQVGSCSRTTRCTAHPFQRSTSCAAQTWPPSLRRTVTPFFRDAVRTLSWIIVSQTGGSHANRRRLVAPLIEAWNVRREVTATRWPSSSSGTRCAYARLAGTACAVTQSARACSCHSVTPVVGTCRYSSFTSSMSGVQFWLCHYL